MCLQILRIIYAEWSDTMVFSNTTGMAVYTENEVCILKDKAFCVTGHREKLIEPYKGNPENFDITCTAIKMMLDRYISGLMDEGYTTMLSGLAEGFDLWAAECMLKRKRYMENCHLIGVMPFMRHSNGFSRKNKELLRVVERYADYLVTTCDDFRVEYGRKLTAVTNPDVYRKRNYFLVDSSTAVIAFCNKDEFRSGTSQTIRYSMRQGIPVYCFGIDDVYELLDNAGLMKGDIYNELLNRKIEPCSRDIFF